MSDSLNSDRCLLSIMVVTLDHKMVPMTNLIRKYLYGDEITDREAPEDSFYPVIRIFGSSDKGQRICVHVHGVLPYLYFRPEHMQNAIFASKESIRKFIRGIEPFLEELLRTKNEYNGKKAMKKKRVDSFEVVKKKTIYGFYQDSLYFIKIFLRDPNDMYKLASIIEEGAIGGIIMQSYESHIPYILKFTSDYNISPMGWLHVDQAKFRGSLPQDELQTFAPPRLPEHVSNQMSGNVDEVESPNRLTNSFMSPTSSHSNSVGIFTQRNTSSDLLWSSVDYQIPSGREDDFALRLETNNNVNNDNDNNKVENNQNENVYNNISENKIPEKESMCDIEIDLHRNNILNPKMKIKGFGSELWSEERVRCLRKNIDFEDLPNPPFTCTNYRTKQQNEVNYEQRFDRLVQKGIALRKTSSLLMRRQSNIEKVVLSQYCRSQDGNDDSNDNNIPLDNFDEEQVSQWLLNSQPDDDDQFDKPNSLQKWAIDKIRKVEKSIQRDEEILQSVMQNDSQLLEEEYIRSSQNHNDCDEKKYTFESYPEELNPNKGLDEYLIGNDLEIEERLTADEISQENNDIIASTQIVYESHKFDQEETDKSNFIESSESNIIIDTEGNICDELLYQKPPLAPNSSNKLCVANYSVDEISSSSSLKITTNLKDNIDMSKTPKNKYSVRFDSAEANSEIKLNNSDNNKSSMKRPQSLSSVFNKKRRVSSEPMKIRFSLLTNENPTKGNDYGNKNIAIDDNDNNQISSSSNNTLIDINQSQSIYVDKDGEIFHGSQTNNEAYSTFNSPSLIADFKIKEILWLRPAFEAPLFDSLLPLHIYGLEDTVNKSLFYSDKNDCVKPTIGSKNIFNHLKIKGNLDMDKFDGGYPNSQEDNLQVDNNMDMTQNKFLSFKRSRCLIPTFTPPLILLTVNNNNKNENKNPTHGLASQILSPTQTISQKTSDSNFESTGNIGAGAISNRVNRTTLLSVELLCQVRTNYLPNPKYDAIQCIIWIAEDTISDSESEITNTHHGIICVLNENDSNNSRDINAAAYFSGCGLPNSSKYELVANEQELFLRFVRLVHFIDPDFFIGYDIQSKSIGYIVKRGKIINMDMLQLLSKTPQERPSGRNDMDDILIEDHESGLFITGRIILNIWQRMRSELKLNSYTYNNVADNLLSIRIPHYNSSQLFKWFNTPNGRFRTIRHLHKLTELNLLLIEKIDLIRRTSESARLYGIDFFSVISRGSQYRVEASLLKNAHANDFLLLSPSKRKVAAQAPMEVIPLVMEPRSQFYHDPVVVLDFQSLYPSMIIAYNLCFSTIMGKLKTGNLSAEIDHHPETSERLGVTSYPEDQSAISSILHLNSSSDDSAPYVSPNGSVFCGKSIRLGILPTMVKEMLDTRIMIKRSMKRHKSSGNKILTRVLDARQLAVKLLSNVTYGYTAAGFSGRMPMAELADAIVQSGRSTLEWTIQYIKNHPDWRAEVVYGDTDSVFVLLRGRTREDAFAIGNQIAAEITAKSPQDVLLKFEKVYLPCILVTKKRYVGYAYETLAQEVPNFDAKGIEVVRRDQCPATVKIQEKSIRILFDTKDISQLKSYLKSQWDKMLQGGDKLLIRDFIFSKEVRFGRYASVSSQPPGAIVATKAVLLDEMAVPPYNWRVPYVVVNGYPNSPLKNLVHSPEEVLKRGTTLRLNYIYYITKCINPSLDRVLSLCDIDIHSWFKSMSRPKLRLRHINYDLFNNNQSGVIIKNKQTSMDQFTTKGSCEICTNDSLPQKTLCSSCTNNKFNSFILLRNRLNNAEQQDLNYTKICLNCSKCSQPSTFYNKGEMVSNNSCESLDCVVFHERCRIITKIEDFRVSLTEIEDLTLN